MMHYIVHYGPNIIESGSLEMKIFFLFVSNYCIIAGGASSSILLYIYFRLIGLVISLHKRYVILGPRNFCCGVVHKRDKLISQWELPRFRNSTNTSTCMLKLNWSKIKQGLKTRNFNVKNYYNIKVVTHSAAWRNLVEYSGLKIISKKVSIYRANCGDLPHPELQLLKNKDSHKEQSIKSLCFNDFSRVTVWPFRHRNSDCGVGCFH